MTIDYQLAAAGLHHEFADEAARRYLVADELGCTEWHGAVAVAWRDGTAGLLSADGQPVAQSAQHDLLTPNCRRQHLQQIETEQTTAIYLGAVFPCWGNYVSDGLRKLWYLQTDDGRRLTDGGVRLVVLAAGKGASWQPYLDLLRLAGLPPDRIDIVQTTRRYAHIYVPDNSLMLRHDGRYYTRHFLSTIESLRRSAAASTTTDTLPSGRIYLTRTHYATWRREVGEAAIEREFARRGYTIVAPERLTVARQVALMQQCSEIVATEGSVAHTTVFCRPHTRVTLLMKVDALNSCQMTFNQVADLDVTYVKANRTVVARRSTFWAGPFYLDLTSQPCRHLQMRPRRRLPLCLRPSWWLHVAVSMVKKIWFAARQ